MEECQRAVCSWVTRRIQLKAWAQCRVPCESISGGQRIDAAGWRVCTESQEKTSKVKVKTSCSEENRNDPSLFFFFFFIPFWRWSSLEVFHTQNYAEPIWLGITYSSWHSQSTITLYKKKRHLSSPSPILACKKRTCEDIAGRRNSTARKMMVQQEKTLRAPWPCGAPWSGVQNCEKIYFYTCHLLYSIVLWQS